MKIIESSYVSASFGMNEVNVDELYLINGGSSSGGIGSGIGSVNVPYCHLAPVPTGAIVVVPPIIIGPVIYKK